jgi:4-amino-4-deoxychorismate lyase
MKRILINGIAAEYVSATDRGLHYGDGLFETIACTGAHPVFIEQHLERMQQGAQRLDIPFPDRQLLLQDINVLLANRSSANSVIKLILTRGQGQRGYRYDRQQIPTRLCMLSDLPDHVAHWQLLGLKACFCKTRASINPQLAGIKSLNRLENVLASNELGNDYDEGFLADSDGNVIEGTMTNLFAVQDGVLVTPDLSRSGIHGVMREHILDIARNADIKVETRPLTPHELMQAEEIFVSNSVIGLCVVKQLEQQSFQSDTMAKTISKILQKRIEADAETVA